MKFVIGMVILGVLLKVFTCGLKFFLKTLLYIIMAYFAIYSINSYLGLDLPIPSFSLLFGLLAISRVITAFI